MITREQYNYLLDAYKELCKQYHLLAYMAGRDTSHLAISYDNCDEITCIMNRKVINDLPKLQE